MSKLLERNIETLDRRLVLVAPPHLLVPDTFHRVCVEPGEHRRLIRDAQRLRGAVYLNDGAVQREQLSPDGRHQTPEDDRSWHLLFTDRGKVTACIWFMEHEAEPSFDDLRVHNSPLAKASEWRAKLWYAVEWDLARARAEGLSYGEVGGWAVSRESCPSDGLILALAAYSLAHNLGGVQAMTTATARHLSSTILRRLGGTSLVAKGEEIPPYYDEKYGCMMEILRFDSRRPNARYAPLVDMLRRKLWEVPAVACAGVPALGVQPVPHAYVA
jgi:hypothetical protein